MVHSEHDSNFKQLNSELWRQCEAATRNAHSLLEESAADWEDREQTGAATPPTAYTLGSLQSQSPGSVHPLVARLGQAKVISLFNCLSADGFVTVFFNRKAPAQIAMLYGLPSMSLSIDIMDLTYGKIGSWAFITADTL